MLLFEFHLKLFLLEKFYVFQVMLESSPMKDLEDKLHGYNCAAINQSLQRWFSNARNQSSGAKYWQDVSTKQVDLNLNDHLLISSEDKIRSFHSG